MWCAWWGCWRGAFGVCIQFLSLIGVTVQVLGAPRDLLHHELTKHTSFCIFVVDPGPFQQILCNIATCWPKGKHPNLLSMCRTASVGNNTPNGHLILSRHGSDRSPLPTTAGNFDINASATTTTAMVCLLLPNVKRIRSP